MPDKPFDLLAIGDTVFEVSPWDGMIHRRIIDTVITTQFIRFGEVNTTTRFLVDGPMTSDNRLTPESFGKTYFGDAETARRVCAERSLELKEERRTNIAKEIADLQKQLADAEDS